MARVRGVAAAAGVAFVAVMLTAVACGGGKSAGPASPPPDAAGGSGGGGTGGGGSGGGGGGSDPGSSGGGSTDPGASGGSPDPGAGSGGTAGGGTAGGGTTGGGTSGGSDACAGLIPAPDAGHALRFDTGTHRSCDRATSDTNGQVAIGFVEGDGSRTFLLYPSDGTARQGIVAKLLHVAGLDLDAWFHPTSAGWTGIVHDPPPGVALRAFDGAGGVLWTSQDIALSSAPDGHGGTVMLAIAPATTTTSGPGGPTMLQWVDARGGIARTVALDEHPTMLLVGWATDHVLTLEPAAGGLRARWYDGVGTPLTASFAAGPPLDPGGTSLHLLLDGSVALRSDQAWRGVFRDGVAAVDPPPAWLAARPGTRLASIRNGRAYAVLPLPGGSLTQPGLRSFEIVSAGGDSCGTVALPAPPDEPGVTHATAVLDVGWDGTVFETEMLGGAALGQGIHCGFRWWPALLR